MLRSITLKISHPRHRKMQPYFRTGFKEVVVFYQRVGNVNPMKMARCIVELERIYGIKHGNNGKTMNNSRSRQKDLASNIGIDESQLRNYKKLNQLIPEFQELVWECCAQVGKSFNVEHFRSKENYARPNLVSATSHCL